MAENVYAESDMIAMILGICLVVVTIYLFFTDMCETRNKNGTEEFGALQSLYSNDGIQDAYLTIENDPDDPANHDPYAYWRGVTWNLPTRNLNRIMFYPYLFEYYVDRYAKLYPYW